MADQTGRTTRTIAYWVDLYRCVDNVWKVDSFISYSEYPRDDRLLEGPAVLQALGEYSLLSDNTIQRVRGATYPTKDYEKYEVQKDLMVFKDDIALPPGETFGIVCESSSSSSSTSSSSTSSTSVSSSSSSSSVSTSSSSSGSSSSISSSTSSSSSSTSVSSSSLSSASSSSSSVSNSSSSSSSSSSISNSLSSSSSSFSLSSSSLSSASSSSMSSSSISGIPLEFTANINSILSTDEPSPNGFEVDEVAEATGFSAFDFVTSPGPLVAIIVESTYPRKDCMTDGVTTIEVDGIFNGLPASRVLTYSEFISDNVFGGKVTFVNPIPADLTITDITQITVFLEDC